MHQQKAYLSFYEYESCYVNVDEYFSLKRHAFARVGCSCFLLVKHAGAVATESMDSQLRYYRN